MPLSAKGQAILSAMQKEYGEKKGESVFYASQKAGKISGVDAADMEAEGWSKLEQLFGEWIKEEKAEPEHAQDAVRELLAFDRSSARTYDQDGRLHVTCHISKANVCPYRGAEIPNSEALGLDPNKIYYLYRDPGELEKAASSFNNIPLLFKHVPVTVTDHRPELVVGSTGTDAKFNAPYLDNSIVVWDGAAIANIEHDLQKELSCAYRYEADMVAGEVDGTKYDGVMRNIRGNHVALVEAGRAGSDVVVGDKGDFIMPVVKKPTFRAAAALGAITGFIGPKLAQDQRFDAAPIKALLNDVSAKSWLSIKPRLATVLLSGVSKLGLDADMEDICKMLDSLDDAAGPAGDDIDSAMDDEETEAEREERLRRRAADRDCGMSAMDDEEPETEAEKERRMEDRKKSESRAEDARKSLGRDESEEERDARVKKEREEDRKAEDAKRANDAKTKGSGMDKAAMDAAIKVAVKNTEQRVMQRMTALNEAKNIVRPVVGEVSAAMDSAEDVYKFALDQNSIDTAGVHPSAYKPMVESILLREKPAADPGGKPKMATDASTAALAKWVPDVARILPV